MNICYYTLSNFQKGLLSGTNTLLNPNLYRPCIYPWTYQK